MLEKKRKENKNFFCLSPFRLSLCSRQPLSHYLELQQPAAVVHPRRSRLPWVCRYSTHVRPLTVWALSSISAGCQRIFSLSWIFARRRWSLSLGWLCEYFGSKNGLWLILVPNKFWVISFIVIKIWRAVSNLFEAVGDIIQWRSGPIFGHLGKY